MSRLVPLKHIVGINESTLPENTGPDTSIRYVDISTVGQGHLLSEPKELSFGDAPSRARRMVNPGDILVSTVRTYLRAVWPVTGQIDKLVASTGFAVVSPREIYSPYLGWALQSSHFIDEVVARSVGVSYPAINPNDLASICISVPHITSQKVIAHFLDSEVSRIDILIGKKQRMISLLNERIDSQIREVIGQSALATTNGNFKATLIKRVLRRKLEAGEPTDEMITAFRDGIVTARRKRRTEGYTEAWTENTFVIKVHSRDVVLHGLDGFAGAIGCSDSDGVCSPVYHVCEPADDGDSHFYGRLLRFLAVSGYLGGFATSTRERAVDLRNWDLVGRIPIPVVPVETQRRIGEQIRRLQPLKEAVERSSELASERRQALITAAVTGQIDIPGVAA